MDSFDPTFTEKDDFSELPLDTQISEILASLESYDYANLNEIAMHPPYLMAGNPLRQEQFIESGLTKDLLNDIDKSLEKGEMPIVTGAYRMGKTTLGMAWKDQKEKRFRISALGYKLEQKEEIKNLKENDEIFIDELNQIPENIETLTTLISTKYKIVIGTSLNNYTELKEAIEKTGATVSPIIVGLVPTVQLQDYVARSLKLNADDQLALNIARLSGGSPMVANIICNELALLVRMHHGDAPQKLVKELLSSSKSKIMAFIDEWDELRTKTDQSLQKHIPNPLLRYL